MALDGLKEIFKEDTEYICNNTNEYIEKIGKIKDCTINTERYTNKNDYKNKISQIYVE